MIDTIAKEVVRIFKRDSKTYSTASEQVEYLIDFYFSNLNSALLDTPNHTLRYNNLLISQTRLATALNNPIHRITLYKRCEELLVLNSLQEIL